MDQRQGTRRIRMVKRWVLCIGNSDTGVLSTLRPAPRSLQFGRFLADSGLPSADHMELVYFHTARDWPLLESKQIKCTSIGGLYI